MYATKAYFHDDGKPASLHSLYVDAITHVGPNYPTVHVGNNINDE